MNETRRKVLIEELEEAVQERDNLTAFIETLAARLGVEAPERQGERIRDANQAPNPNAVPSETVNEAEFYGQSAPKASRALLERFGPSRPMKTDEIYQAISKGGVRTKDADTLYRSLRRDPGFHKVGRGLWGLSEWYPNRVTATRADNDDGEPAEVTDEQNTAGEPTIESEVAGG